MYWHRQRCKLSCCSGGCLSCRFWPSVLKCQVGLDRDFCRSYRATSPARRYSPVVSNASRAFQFTRIKLECFRDERFVKARTVNPKNFFAALKRRNVYKVAIAYAVVAWLLLQAASILFPTFEAPTWTMKVFVAVTALGFPIALIIAWAFELTPEGLKRTEFADELPKKSSRSREWIKGVIIAGVISVSLFFLGRYTATSK